ncbi:MAG: hypothetical protein JXK94_13905 [Deltaproteobacteria bacterium]|nr:hypothetical protein [Deltaproteobacteria bacterium]
MMNWKNDLNVIMESTSTRQRTADQAQPATVFQNCTIITGSKAVVNAQPQPCCCPWRYVLAVLAALAVLLGLVKVEGPHTQPPGLWA